ncbi:hypothetical protein AVDCRST_MAG94-678 [uncultured Leptolyngbya sp.]|uniref:Uncharacterized protein n=1 Tax=uncultured Leptolyngbya sp. TaxID=332963 RepID=A0A6J4KH69_9CYAN|nr:hypothetical protein AVDCRST_MAG94-678 [uncultured Leptolyngbya sp.]
MHHCQASSSAQRCESKLVERKLLRVIGLYQRLLLCDRPNSALIFCERYFCG